MLVEFATYLGKVDHEMFRIKPRAPVEGNACRVSTSQLSANCRL